MKIVHAASKTSDFLRVVANYIAIETDFAANLCDTLVAPYSAKVKWSQLESFATEPPSCLSMSKRRVGDKGGLATIQA